MTELKTLKDLKEENNWINIVDVKKEAIKWVKHIQKFCKDCNVLRKINNNKPFCWRCGFWMRRFNITGDDLK